MGLKIKSQRDFWSGVMFIVVGLGFAWGATLYRFGASARPGPGYFPFGLGILLAVLGAIVLFVALSVETEDGDPIGPWAYRPLFIIMGSVVLFGFVLPRLGMFISLPLLIVTCSLAGDEFHWKDAVLSSLILTIGSWLVFIKGLGLIIPTLPIFITG